MCASQTGHQLSVQRKEKKSKFDKYVAETKEHIATLQTQHAAALGNISNQLETKTKEVLSLRGKLRAANPVLTTRRPTQSLQGGKTARTQRKLAAELQSFLEERYATQEAREQAVF